MATSVYFNNYNSLAEQRVIEDLIVESIKIMGFDAYYLPIENETDRDILYGEDPIKRFSSAFPIEFYLSSSMEYGGEKEFFSKFGLEIKNTVNIMLSKRSFSQRVPQDSFTRPREGDLIYVPFLNGTGELFEIKFTNQTKDFFMLGRKIPFFYELELEKFKYSQETIDVGIPDVDNVVVQDAYNVTLMMTANNASNNFTVGEAVTANTSGVSGTVTYWDRPTGTLKVTDLLGTFANNQMVTGNTSGAHFVIHNAVDPLTDPQEREMYDNFVIQTEADNYVDLSENNPFGLPT